MTLLSAPRIGLAGRDMVYLQLTGVPTLYADTPDTPALSITGNISLRARVALDDWTPTLTNTIVAKEDNASARSYHLSVDTDGTILLMLSEDGATFDHINSDTAAGFSDTAPGWIRADADLADSLVTFYTGGAGRVPVWTQLGDPVATTEASIDDNASAVQIGRTLAGLEATDGKIFRVQIYDDETLVFDADFDEPKNEGAATITENASGATVTLQGAASLDSQASQAAGDYELLWNANQAAAGFVDRDVAPGGGGGGAQEWALFHDGLGASPITADMMKIANWGGNPFNSNDPWTFEVWTRATDTLWTNGGLIDVGASYSPGLWMESLGNNNTRLKTSFNFSDDYTEFYDGTGEADGTNWVHVAIAFNPALGSYGGYEMYKNGTDVGGRNNEHTVNIAQDEIRILGNERNTARLNMEIFDLRFWNVLRTPTEIADNYNQILTGSESGLVAWFKLNDGEGTTPVDELGNTTSALDQTNSRLSWVAITDPR